MTEPLLPTRFLFRFAADCLYLPGLAPDAELGEQHLLPALGELEGQAQIGDVRAAWSEAGLLLAVRVDGKQHPLWCRENRLEDSDGLQVWIDTRDTHNIHRASRFCQRFIFLPAGAGRQNDQPLADQLLIDRARENATPVRPGQLKARAKVSKSGYQMSAFIPAAAMTGLIRPTTLGWASPIGFSTANWVNKASASAWSFRSPPIPACGARWNW
jgi:hypothetical protein